MSRPLSLAISILVLGLPARLDAASISYTTSADTHTQEGFIPLFDPSLGTLVEVDVSATGAASALADASGVPAGTVVTPSGFVALLLEPAVGTVGGTTFDGPSFTVDPSNPLGSVGADFAVSNAITTDLGGFYGVASENLQILGALNASPAMTSEFYASADVTITYNYEAGVFPEPSSLALGAVGVACCAAWGVRRRVA